MNKSLLTAVFLVVCLATFGQTNNWTGGAGTSNWNDGANWSLGVPLNSHDILISGASVDINAGVSAVAASIQILSGSSLTIAAGDTLTVDGVNTTNPGSVAGILIDDAALVNNGTLHVNNSQWCGIYSNSTIGPSINNSGMLEVNTFGTFAPCAGIYSDGASEIFNAGDIIVISTISGNDADGIFNEATTTFENQGSVNISGVSGSSAESLVVLGMGSNSNFLSVGAATNSHSMVVGPAGTFNNSATLNITGSSSTGLRNEGSFTNLLAASLNVNTSDIGIHNFESIINEGSIDIANAITTGFLNEDTFNNNTGANLHVAGGNTAFHHNGAPSPLLNAGIIDLEIFGQYGLHAQLAGVNNTASGTIEIHNGQTAVNLEDVVLFENFGTIDIHDTNFGVNYINSSIENWNTFQLTDLVDPSGVAVVGGINTDFTNFANLNLTNCGGSGINLLNNAQFENLADMWLSQLGVDGIRLQDDSQFNHNGNIVIIHDIMSSGLKLEGNSTLNNNGGFDISDCTNAVENNGSSFNNSSILSILNGSNGIVNHAQFNSNAAIVIDNSSLIALNNTAGATFSNGFSLDIISTALGSNTGISNAGNFNCTGNVRIREMDQIGITNSGSFDSNNEVRIDLMRNPASVAIEILNSGQFTVMGDLNISSSMGTGVHIADNGNLSFLGNNFFLFGVGGQGLLMDGSAVMINDGSSFIIDGTGNSGIELADMASFDNRSQLTINNVGLHGIINGGSNFTNSSLGMISVQDGQNGINNSADFSNDGMLTVQGFSNYGIYSDAGQYVNSSSGTVSITAPSLASANGLFNSSNFLNDGDLGVASLIDGSCLLNSGTFTNNNIITLSTGQIGLQNQANFTNSAGAQVNIFNVTGGSGIGLRNETAMAVYTENGATTISGGTNNNVVNENGALIQGNGSFTINLFDNRAAIAPGQSIGTLTINGDLLSSDPLAIIEMEINGLGGAGVDPNGHDQIVVNGATNLGGTLRTLTNGFVPNPPDCFTLIDAASLSGIFSALDQPNYGFWIRYDFPDTGEVTACEATILPVELVSFEGEIIEGNKASLTWRTSAETNFSHFEIQESVDALNWHSIGQLNSQGSANTGAIYEFVRSNPVTDHEGNVYYRLVMHDRDSTYEYSDILALKIESDESFAVFPNPAKVGDKLTIKGIKVEHLQWFDVKGAQVTVSNELDQLTIPVLPSGTYFLLINGHISEKIVIVE